MGNLLRSSIVLFLWSTHGVHGRTLLEPTQPPRLADDDLQLRTTYIVEPQDFRHMAKRQETDIPVAFTITIAPDATCGFISGNPYNPVTCENRHYQCSWWNSGPIICGAIFEEGQNWVVHLSCFEREKVLNTHLCNDICQSNNYYLLCTEMSAPYCLTYAYPKGVKDYKCAPTSVFHSVSFTVDSDRAAEFITTTVSLSTATETSYTLTATETEPVTTTIPETSMTIPPSTLPSSKLDSNLGAIIGGAVGGFAALLLIALTIFWFVRRSKRDGARLSNHTPYAIRT